jgi:antitoxin PrlF
MEMIMIRERSKAKQAERLYTRPEGATMAEVRQVTGGPRYNELKSLESRGYTIRKVKSGQETRYFAVPPAAPIFEATVTTQGQITIPKEIRERLGLRAGGKLRLMPEAENRVVLTLADLSVKRLFGVLGKPPRSATIEDMNEAGPRRAIGRYMRTKR